MVKCVSKLCWMGALLAVSVLACGQHRSQQPYHETPSVPLTYNGAGREDPEPTGLTEVRIVYFGPGDSGRAARDSIWEGATLAIENANHEGGYKGLPFRLIPVWAPNPWAGGAANLIKAIYAEPTWAVLGGTDGATTHLAEQVVTKALVTLINPVSTDTSIHHANLPWIFSIAPGAEKAADLIGTEIKNRAKAFALLSGTDHDSRAFVSALERAFKRQQIAPVLHLETEDAHLSGAAAVDRALHAGAQVMVVAAGSEESTLLIKTLRQSGFAGPIYAGPELALNEPDVLLLGVVVPQLGNISEDFRNKFQLRYGRAPDCAAALAFDAANVIVASMRKGGLNRSRIRDAVRQLSPYQGVSGRIEWDNLGQNLRAVTLHPITKSQKEIPPITGEARP